MHANTALGLSPESSHKLIERRSQVFKIDRLIPSVIGAGVAICVLKYITISISPEGEYQLNRAVSMLGLGGMLMLLVIEVIVYALTRDIVERVYIRRMHKLIDEGVSPDLVVSAIESQHISLLMKAILLDETEEYLADRVR